MTLPPFPTIDGLDWAPPTSTGGVQIGRSSGALWIRADADNAGYADDVLDQPRDSGAPRLNNWWDGCAPAGPRSIVGYQYWRLVPGTFTHLSAGTSLEKSWSYQHGVSTTDSQSLTATMGIQAEGLSAGLSATFSHSVTISDQQTQTTQYSVGPTPEGKVRVWMLWDLIYEFSLINTDNGQMLPAGTYRGDVDFTDDDHYSGAYLNYRFNHLVISSGNLCSRDALFDA
jgi:hypothetical protein